MKKFLALFLCVMLMAMPVFAATQSDFEDALSQQVYNASFNGSITFEAQTVPEYIQKYLFDTKISYSGDVDIAEDYSSMKMHVKVGYTLPKELMGGQEITQDMWYDFNSEKMLCISEGTKGKYQYFDCSKVEGYSDFMTKMLDKDFIESTNAATKEVLTGVGTYDIKGNTAEITFTADELKSLASGIADTLKPMVDEMLASVSGDVDVKAALKAVADCKLFADDAVVVNVEINDDKSLKNFDVSVNVDTNVYEIAETLSKYIEGATPDNEVMKKDNSDLKMSVKMSYDIDKLTEDFADSFPTLTDENSVNIEPLMSAPSDGSININVNNKKAEYDVMPEYINDVLYIPLRKTLNLMGVEDSSIIYQDGIIVSQINGETIITAINSKLIAVGEENINLDSPIIEKNDRTLVPTEFFDHIANGNFIQFVRSNSATEGANVLFILN